MRIMLGLTTMIGEARPHWAQSGVDDIRLPALTGRGRGWKPREGGNFESWLDVVTIDDARR